MTRKARHARGRPVLNEIVGRAVVVAYREDVNRLVSSLAEEGFHVEVLRAEYTDEEMTFTKNSRTFITHRKAWQKAADSTGYTLICEADFVPCRGIGNFDVFWPLENDRAWGYLYQGSPRLLAVVGPQRFLRGHTSPLVCYVINKTVGELMLEYFEVETKQRDLRTYFTFDSHLQWYIMGLGAEAFIPRRHYGEHGGLPNAEHANFGRLSNDGRHRADNLMSSLHFLPSYANGSHLSFLRVRLEAHLSGFARLLLRRWIVTTNVYHLSPVDRAKMYLIGFRRLFSLPF